MTCAQGCRYNNGQAPTGTGNGYSGGYSSYSGSSDNERGSCATANSVCGTSWTWEGGAAADDDTCPIGGTSPVGPRGPRALSHRSRAAFTFILPDGVWVHDAAAFPTDPTGGLQVLDEHHGEHRWRGPHTHQHMHVHSSI